MSPILNAHAFKKGEQAYSRLFGLWPFDQGGTGYIFAQIQRKIKVFLFIDLLTVIQ